MNNFIYKCYDEFKKFMDLKEDILPNLNIIVQEADGEATGKSSLAFVNVDEVLANTVNLYINPIIFSYKEEFQKSIMFHEFTHILDAVTLFKPLPYNEMVALLSTYSEYHASQMELACNIGFKSIHSYKKLNLDKTFVAYENKMIKIEMDYLHPLADALCIIDKDTYFYYDLDIYDYYLNYSVFETKSMYYLGKRNLCERISLKKIADITDKSFDQFASYIRNMENCIESENFNSLIIARKQLWNKYTSNFICKNQNLLPGAP